MTTIAIVAMSASAYSFHMDYERGETADEVWGINSAGLWYRQVQKIIALDDLERDLGTHPEYVSRLVTCGLPVITTRAFPQWPTTKAYPWAEVLADVFRGDMWLARFALQNTQCYALALAILKQPGLVMLYGCDFTRPDDPALLRAAWPGRAVPYWFKYHDAEVVKHRYATEPGEGGMYMLMGIANERGIRIGFGLGSTLLDRDRAAYFYGYEEQPEIVD